MGYPLPDLEAITDDVCISLHVPDNPEVLRAFWGALLELTYPWNWAVEDTDETRPAAKATAQYMADWLATQRYANVPYVCPNDEDPDEDDAPYWDDVVSAAGAGEGERWGYENILDWGVTAFLAVAGSPAAALFYKTTVSRARIAFKSLDAGAIVNILIDGILAAAVPTVSTTAGVSEIIEVDIDLVQFAADNGLSGVERIIRLVAA